MNTDRLQRAQFVRPIVVAMALTIFGELLILYMWGIALFPAGSLASKLVWTVTCGIAMGATIGSLVNVFVTGRIRPRIAALISSLIYFAVLSFCVGLCYQIDLSLRLFGAVEAPALFILGGLIPALLTSVLYGWLLHSARGQAALARVGL